MTAKDWAMQVVAVVDRLKRSLSDRAHEIITWLQVGQMTKKGVRGRA